MSRARHPNHEGYVTRNGVRLFYEVSGSGRDTILLLPTWSIIHSRLWKAQIAYLARHFRVITFDGRGNGKSDRPPGVEAYAEAEFAADALAVLDATETREAFLAGLSCGALWATLLAANHPERVRGVAYIGPSTSLAPNHPERAICARFEEDLTGSTDPWAKYNRHYWRKDYRGFLEFFFGEMFTEPHSTKQIEDCIEWALETDPETLANTMSALSLCRLESFEDTVSRIQCPVLVIHGDDDRIRPHAQGAALAEATGGRLVTMEGVGHGPQARKPVEVNRLLYEFAGGQPPRRVRSKRPRALFVSSPIGLGHARRDVAIAQDLRRLHPDLDIDWLAQNPVTRVLEAEGERIHPASAHLANESAHFESESAEHDLHCFQAWRRMDEILIANFMVFHDVVEAQDYDLWIGDEAWELDYFLHENPSLKRAPYVWLTDFVGWLPVDGEAALTADYNAEMIEHIDRHPGLRDRALFVGEPDDVVPDAFGADLPLIRDWTERHFDFPGYVTGFAPVPDRERLRSALGYGPEPVCLVTVGGSGVGGALLRSVIAAYPLARERVPGLRMIVVAGPRIDPATLPPHPGLEIRAYVRDLYQHLAACDLAVVQGGLTTAMELTANQRPFLAFPLRHHFEQNFHVRHRLERYGAGRFMDFETDGPEQIADAIAQEIGRQPEYLAVDTYGATRAAALISDLL
ncbi:alpha/beta fold hydrolase [Solirubrobacter sp. CPCC 204708]|uniref:Alpha/beta fold hydrolase n=1 Tax=Solirubrobacter deserti TaxID=2282478 RepID=A0ABT4RR60_9ACTN|nr:alpha/beta hydrolase [Solirubrobacter deserti]MBE2314747.1 alpha/beta fold hydrolase [Solirubrobacter deserti]MDA0141064.1 alpha/beta fold hydrolase [Solirubrobacter deserti]